jgi:hypothetical protein
MENRPLIPAQQHGNKRILIALEILGLFVLATLVGGWAYLRFSGHNMTGLDGTWRDTNNPRHIYEFQSSGRRGHMDLPQILVEQDWVVRDMAAGRTANQHSD